MSGLSQRQVLSLALAWVFPGLAPLWAAGDPKLAGPGRGGVRSQRAFRLVVPRLAGSAAPSALSLHKTFLISSFPASTGSNFHPVRFRGRTGWRVSGNSSSRLLYARRLSLPTGFHPRRAEDLTDLLPSRCERGGEATGAMESETAFEVKRRPSRLPLSAGAP